MSALQQKPTSIQNFSSRLEPSLSRRAGTVGTHPSRQAATQLAQRGTQAPSGARVRHVAPQAAAQTEAQTSTSNGTGGSAGIDWRLCLALGICAFEAYTENPQEDAKKEKGGGKKKKTAAEAPAPAAAAAPLGIVRDNVPNGTMTYFLDEEYLMAHFKGRLELTVKGATGLPRADLLGKPDAFCKVELSGVSLGGIQLQGVGPKGSGGTTKRVDNHHNPVWNETFNLFVTDPTQQSLTVTVLDDDLHTDDVLGSSTLSAAELGALLVALPDGKPQELEVEVKDNKGKARGKVQLEARYHPFTDKAAAAKATSTFHIDKNNAWNILKAKVEEEEVKSLTPLPEFKLLSFIDNQDTETQVLMFWNNVDKTVCISFRGTEVSETKDILADLNLRGSELHPLEDGTLLEIQPSPDVWVHAGFRNAYFGVRAEVLSIVDALLSGKDKGWTIYVTGHSLGGALSTLCAGDLAVRTDCQIVLYNYGSPRVGNRPFAEDMRRLVPNAWRVVNKEDIVTQIPPPLGYCHVGNECTLMDAGGNLIFPLIAAYGTDPKEGLAELDMFEEVKSLLGSALEKDSSVAHHSGHEYAESILKAIFFRASSGPPK